MNTEVLQNILSNVEDMKLDEGAYLEFSNMLKEMHTNLNKKEEKHINTVNIDAELTFIGDKDTITIQVIKKYLYADPTPDKLLIEINNREYTLPHPNFNHKLIHLYMLCATKEIKIVTEDITINTTLKEYTKNLINMNKAISKHDDDDDSQYEYSMSYIFGTMLGVVEL